MYERKENENREKCKKEKESKVIEGMRKRRNVIELKEREKMYKRREKWENV